MSFDTAKGAAYVKSRSGKRSASNDLRPTPSSSTAQAPKRSKLSESGAAPPQIHPLAPRLAALIDANPSLRTLFPVISQARLDEFKALSRERVVNGAEAGRGVGEEGAVESALAGESEEGGGEEEEDGEREEGDIGDDADQGDKRMQAELAWIRKRALTIPKDVLAQATKLFIVVQRGYSSSVNPRGYHHWELKRGKLQPADGRSFDKRSDRLLEIEATSGLSYLLLSFAILLDTEPWLVEHYQTAFARSTNLDPASLLRPGHEARTSSASGLYLLFSPAGVFYFGMSTLIWHRMMGHNGTSSSIAALHSEKQLHPFSTWRANVIVTVPDDYPSAFVHILESLLIASAGSVSAAGRGANTNLFDLTFPQRSLIPGRHVVNFFIAVHAHIATGGFIPPFPYPPADYGWSDLFAASANHHFRPTYLYNLIVGRQRQGIMGPLLSLFPIPDDAWNGAVPGRVVARGSSGRDTTSFAATKSRPTTQAREDNKRLFGLNTRPV